MVRKNNNKSNFHYCANIYENEDIISSKYFMTMKELEQHFKLSRFTLNNHVKHGANLRKFKNVKITRCCMPVYNKIRINYD